MVKWIVVGAVLLGFLVLILAARPVVGRLPELARALRRLEDRQIRAQALADDLAVVQRRAAELEERAAEAQDRITVIKAARGR